MQHSSLVTRTWGYCWQGYGKVMGLCLWWGMRLMTPPHFSLLKMSSIYFFGFASCRDSIGGHIPIEIEE